MEVLSEEESQQIMASMVSPFVRHNTGSENAGNIQLATSGQNVLLVHGPGQEYKLTRDHDIPELKSDDEVLIRVVAIGLNPIDWKGPDYNFGLPSLPWINGRDCAGVVVKASKTSTRVRVGDVVLSPSTDYRDVRKAAFQEYVISTGYNSARIPRNLPVQICAALGVAFTAAALALGACFGVNYASQTDAALRRPDLLHSLRKPQRQLPADIRAECMGGIALPQRAKPGDWIVIWGGEHPSLLVTLC